MIDYQGHDNALKLNIDGYNRTIQRMGGNGSVRVRVVLFEHAVRYLVTIIGSYDLSPDKMWFQNYGKAILLTEFQALSGFMRIFDANIATLPQENQTRIWVIRPILTRDIPPLIAAIPDPIPRPRTPTPPPSPTPATYEAAAQAVNDLPDENCCSRCLRKCCGCKCVIL